jgi:hypothetical protein
MDNYDQVNAIQEEQQSLRDLEALELSMVGGGTGDISLG